MVVRGFRGAAVAAAVVAVVAAVGTGCAPVGGATRAAAVPPPYTWVAQAVRAHLVAHRTPNGPVRARLANPNSFDDPLTVMPVARSGDWLKVLLPVRPNGSTGWVPMSAVRLSWVPYRVEVSLHLHRLVLYDENRPVLRTAAAVGAPATPTPRGKFYLTALLKQPNPDSGYGPYAFGVSGFSPVLHHFAGGPGQIGLHGTNDPSSLGHSVTHGCIRVANHVIRKLAHRLPLGTPLVVTN